ncbi:hypothetical protein [Paralcaligenes ureilyticus]|uniref:Uncharacterized protein n=1 Tax=Paralcaligenes ureilyticus TaxID=627131 RepID=A0A4R3LNP0_9BURK|nr:hypothetical protein [Paralcaligenes ureilyticus]TCT01771.1 hypothetical protein EDC26_12230 [Paralcaligenes ureilyticus]
MQLYSFFNSSTSYRVRIPGYGSVSMYWRKDELHPPSVEAGLASIRRISRDYEG